MTGRGEKNQQLSEHFTHAEFACRCCGEITVNPMLLAALEELRTVLGGIPIHVNSGYRCEKHNAEVGGKPNSQHLVGNAADIRLDGVSPLDVAKAAKQVAAFRRGGIGVYRSFTHVDVREDGPARWKA